MAKSLEFLPALPRGHYWRLAYDYFGFYSFYIMRQRHWWLPEVIVEVTCPLIDSEATTAEQALAESARRALEKLEVKEQDMGLLRQLALYEGSHRG